MFHHVNPGDPFRPDPAFHNALVDSLNKSASLSASRTETSVKNRCVMQVYNAMETDILAGSPLYLSGKKGIMPAVKTAGTEFFGITEHLIPAKSPGSAVIMGTVAIDQNAITGAGTKYTPGQNGIGTLADEGTFQVLYHESSEATRPVIVLLAANAEKKDESGITYLATIINPNENSAGYKCTLTDLQTGEEIGSGIVFPAQIAYGIPLPAGYTLIAHSANISYISEDAIDVD